MYLIFKTLHVVFVILFLGNITTGLFWHRHAAKTRDAKLLAHTTAGIIRSDRLFTMPGVLGIIITGALAAAKAGLPILETSWILWTIVLFVISGLVFMTRVAPLQKRMHALAAAAANAGQLDEARYASLARQWEMWGALALATPAAGLVLMVLKPVL